MSKILLPHPRDELISFYGHTAIDGLQKLGEVVFNDGQQPWSGPELIEAARDCDVIYSFGVTGADAQLFDSLPRLKAFCRWAVDIRNIDVAAASRAGVLVTNGKGEFAAGVSELILGFMINFNRRISHGAEIYHASSEPVAGIGPELRGSTLSVIGYGMIARYLCDVALALGMRVIVNDAFVKPEDARIGFGSLEQVLAEGDHVVCLAAATPQTENLMNRERFALMKPSAHFVNLSRGNLVDENDLIDALDRNVIAGCSVDVGRAARQKPSMAVARHAKVVATPHIGGLTPAAIERQSVSAVRQVAAILEGKVPERAINLDSAFRFNAGLGAI